MMPAYVGCLPAIVSEAHSGGLRKASLDFRDASGCTAEVRRPGSAPNGDGTTTFSIWAPSARELRISLDGAESPLIAVGDGWFRGVLPSDVGSRYQISADGGPWRPDPASRRLPDGVHGASEVVKRLPALPKWPGRALSELVFYELHIGTFTDEGTFEAAIAHLDDLAALGVTAVELMPIAEVPGRPTRNWGYDGVQLFAVRESYGGAPGLRAFVRACRARGLAVVVDVVYNHLGPEGNYLGELGGWFNDTYRTPWGPAVNLDGAHSDGVRTHLLAHAREMLIEHGADGLRLDSCPNLFDRSPLPFLEELAAAVDGWAIEEGRPLHLVAEADDNDPRWTRPREEHGLGLHAIWSDDLQQSLHALLVDERDGFYVDFGRVSDVARAFCEGVVLDGRPSTFRRQRWGRKGARPPLSRQVSYVQNHDRVGNRGDGARLASLLSPPAHRAALALHLLAPQLPLLFMGQEYGERRPFWFFTSFEDPALGRAVKRGRKDVFHAFGGDPCAPDPQLASTRAASVLDRRQAATAEGQALLALHREALALRRELSGTPTLLSVDEGWGFSVQWPAGPVLVARLTSEGGPQPPPNPRFDTDDYAVSGALGGPRVWLPG